MTAPYEITAVEHLGGHHLRLTFADGFSHPRYQNGAVLDDSKSYILLGAGVGGHFDVFGK